MKQLKKLSEDGVMVADKEGFDVVQRFGYLGDVFDAGGGGCERKRAMRLDQIQRTDAVPHLTYAGTITQDEREDLRSLIMPGSETLPLKLKKNNEERLERAQMVRWMCGAPLRDRKRNVDLFNINLLLRFLLVLTSSFCHL